MEGGERRTHKKRRKITGKHAAEIKAFSPSQSFISTLSFTALPFSINFILLLLQLLH